MNETIAYLAPATAVFVILVSVIAAMFIKAWRDGSLKHDIRWLRAYVRINLRSMKRTITNF